MYIIVGAGCFILGYLTSLVVHQHQQNEMMEKFHDFLADLNEKKKNPRYGNTLTVDRLVLVANPLPKLK